MIFIRYSHKHGIHDHFVKRNVKNIINKDNNNTESIEEDAHGIYSSTIDSKIIDNNNKNIVYIRTKPGDIVLFSNMLIHGAVMNKSEQVRWSLDWRYQNENCKTHRYQQGHII